MRECRPIVAEEAEEFLTLLCNVFDLDKKRASSVFYAEPFFDLRRKWALFVDGEMASILTTTPMEFGLGRAIGIAGVATDERYRGQGMAQELLEVALARSAEEGEDKALLFAHQETVYERVGFETLDVVLRGDLRCGSTKKLIDALSHHEVMVRYREWQERDSRWLIRDEPRWRHWQWVYRSCEPVGTQGYMSYEPLLCREAVLYQEMDEWPLTPGTEWLGLRSLTEALGVPFVGPAKEELLYMGRGFDDVPWMFMTDQF